jgi:hypothetical protein
MAIVYLYRPLSEGQTWTTAQVRATARAIAITFVEHLYRVGEFSITLHPSDPICEYIQENDIVSVDGAYFGIVRAIQQQQTGTGQQVEITGDDLKGMLSQRITLYPQAAIQEGLQGYDAIKDVPTETLVKYFVNNNCVSAANSKRNIYGLTIAPDQQRGLENDQYMTRFEVLTDLLEKNLQPQNMGYSITPDFQNNQYVFDVFTGADHSANQYENNRVIFDVKLKTLTQLEYFFSARSYINTFYASLSKSRNEDETLTCMYYRDGEEESEGISRFETHLNISANLPDAQLYENMRKYALKDATEYERSEELTALTTEKYRYGVDYRLGDTVTVQNRGVLFYRLKQQLNVQIVSVTHQWVGKTITHELSFGPGKISRFDELKREIKNGR